MGLRGFENRLERLVEGTAARVFRSGLTPLEVGYRIAREMDASRSAGVRGHVVVANSYLVLVSPEDDARFSQIEGTLTRDLAESAREHAADNGYDFVGPVQVEIRREDSLSVGRFDVQSSFKEVPPESRRAVLVPPIGGPINLTVGGPSVIGRLGDCTVMFDDSNVSRHHAEIQPTAEGFVVTDLGSTNGTRVNGSPVRQALLNHGDEIMFGSVRVIFEER